MMSCGMDLHKLGWVWMEERSAELRTRNRDAIIKLYDWQLDGFFLHSDS